MRRRDMMTAVERLRLSAAPLLLLLKVRVIRIHRSTKPWRHPRPSAWRRGKIVFDTASA